MLTFAPLLLLKHCHHAQPPETQITILNLSFFSDKSSLKKENNRDAGGTYSANSCGSSSPAPSDPYDHCGTSSKCLADDLLATEV